MKATFIPDFDEKNRVQGFFTLVIDLTERKRLEDELAHQSELLQKIIDGIPVMITIYDPKLETFQFNNAFRETLGWSEEDFTEVGPIEKCYPDPQIQEEVCKYMRSLQHGWRDFRVTAKDGTPVDSSWANIRLSDDTHIGIGVDIRERKQNEQALQKALQEKEGLLKEIHHRVKNNLAVISSLLNLQAAAIEDEKIRSALADCRSRVQSMVIIHENLYQSTDFAKLNLKEYVAKLVSRLLYTYRVHRNLVKVSIDIEDIVIPTDFTVPCGLVLNELISNALKHAFPEEKAGEIGITGRQAGADIIIKVSDNGVGLPDNFDISKSNTLGLGLAQRLVERQMGGTFKMSNNNGAVFVMTFDMSNIAKR